MNQDSRQDQELLNLTRRVISLENELKVAKKVLSECENRVKVLEKARTVQIGLNKKFLAKLGQNEPNKSFWERLFK